MAARRIAQETFDAVLQEKANRYHMDPSGEAVGEALQFKAQGELKCLVSLGGGLLLGILLGSGQEDIKALGKLFNSFDPTFLIC